MPDFENIWQVVWVGGALGVTVIGLYAMVKGWIWPKHMVDRTLREVQDRGDRSAKVVATEVLEGLGVTKKGERLIKTIRRSRKRRRS